VSAAEGTEPEGDEPLQSPPVDLEKHGEVLLVAKGGVGGQGNTLSSVVANSSSVSAVLILLTQLTETTQTVHSTPGMKGQHNILFLELKLIAQVRAEVPFVKANSDEC
jgi:GTPase involved in cell partitioning and DNA repair